MKSIKHENASEDEDSSEEEDLNEEEDSNEEEEEEEDFKIEEEQYKKKRETSFKKHSLVKEVVDWRLQSPWLFLSWNNVQLKRPGSIWIQFMEQMCGKRISIGIWRKVVETHSSKVNTLEQQE